MFFKNTILIQARASQSYSQTALICTHFEQLGYFHMEAKSFPLSPPVLTNPPSPCTMWPQCARCCLHRKRNCIIFDKCQLERPNYFNTLSHIQQKPLSHMQHKPGDTLNQSINLLLHWAMRKS